MRLSSPAAALAAAIALFLAPAQAASAAGGCDGANASTGTASKRTLVRATLCVLNTQRARHDLPPSG